MTRKVIAQGFDHTIPKAGFADGVAVTPGHLVETNGARDADGREPVVPHAAGAEAATPFLVAYNDDYREKTDDYAAGEDLRFAPVTPDMEVELIVGASQTIDPDAGDGSEQLVSNGDGTVRSLNTANTGETAEDVIAVALEAVTTGAGESARVLVRRA